MFLTLTLRGTIKIEKLCAYINKYKNVFLITELISIFLIDKLKYNYIFLVYNEINLRSPYLTCSFVSVLFSLLITYLPMTPFRQRFIALKYAIDKPQ
jgi:hypothetical protein